MGCDTIRRALSAQLDGEDDPRQRPAVDRHLATCVACRQWLDTAARITRLAGTSPVADIPTLSEHALTTILAASPDPSHTRLARTLRAVLGGVAIAQALLGLLQATDFGTAADEHAHAGTSLGGTSPGHLWHESAAWNLAVGAGFLWIAVRRSRAAGLIPTLTAFIGALGLLSAVDAVDGQVQPVRLVSHGLILAGYLIVLALSRTTRQGGDPRRQHHSPAPQHRLQCQEQEAVAARTGARCDGPDVPIAWAA